VIALSPPVSNSGTELVFDTGAKAPFDKTGCPSTTLSVEAGGGTTDRLASPASTKLIIAAWERSAPPIQTAPKNSSPAMSRMLNMFLNPIMIVS
jgi:hypothetical protein